MKEELKHKIIHEFEVYWVYTIFFTLFFCAFTLYRKLILAEYSIGAEHFGYDVFQALILSKIILIGQSFRLGERIFADKPLIVPTLYRTVVFTFFVLLMSLLEHYVIGYLHGKTSSALTEELLNFGIYEILARLLVMFFVFILFFAFLEIDKAIGEKKLFNLFFKGKKSNE